MNESSQDLTKRYSRREEWISTGVHLGGMAAVIAAGILLLARAWPHGAAMITLSAVYIASLLLLYFASSMYHWSNHPRRKRMWQHWDHCAIFVLIAGTYTPLLPLTVGGAGAGWLLAGVWLLAVAGVASELTGFSPFKRFSLVLYLLMGWLCVAAFRPLFSAMNREEIVFLVGGGVVYTAGVVFYVIRRKYFHALWHGFVLGGSVLQYFAILSLLTRHD